MRTLANRALGGWCVVVLMVLPGSAEDCGVTQPPVELVVQANQEAPLATFPAINPDGLVTVFVECPSGTNARWVLDDDGVYRHRQVNDKPLYIKYLPFLANYGLIPHTFIPEEIGGEGEALDIQVLGTALPPGSVVKVRVIGALALLDRGKQDDKLIGVLPGSVFDAVHDIEDLDRHFPGITTILETWWTSFKGQQVTVSRGFVGAAAADRLIQAAMSGYEKQHLKQ